MLIIQIINLFFRKNKIDFDWQFYLIIYPELITHKINNYKKAYRHYNRIGRKENRIFMINQFNIKYPDKHWWLFLIDLHNIKQYDSLVSNYYQLQLKNNLKRFIAETGTTEHYYDSLNTFHFLKDFYLDGNDIPEETNPYKYYHNNGILQGQICSPLQINTFYPNAVITWKNNQFYVQLNEETLPLKEFNQQHFKLEDLMKSTVVHNQYAPEDNSLIVILTIGDINIGKELLSKFRQEHKKYHLIVTVNNDLPVDEIKSYCEANFESYDILTTINYHNDIIPYLIAFNFSSKYTYDYLFKLYTKSDPTWRNRMIEPFFEDGIMEDSIRVFKSNSNIGQICADNLLQNNQRNKKALESVIKQWREIKFVEGSVFIVKRYIQEYFMEKYAGLIQAAAVMPFNFCNELFYDTSPVHTLEGLLGFVVYEKNTKISTLKTIIEKQINPGVVITTNGYNGVFARQCLECFIRGLKVFNNYYIVLFINESEDDITLQFKKYRNENIDIIYIEDQDAFGGLTGTWNKGIDMCLGNDCDVIILSNDDILFDNCINNLIISCYKEKKKMKYFGPTTNNPGPTIQNQCQYNTQPCNEPNKIAKFNNEIINLNGFFMCFSKMVLIENKFNDKFYFDPSKPFGGNETEWFDRFLSKGGTPIIVPKTFIYHYKIARWRKKKKTLNNTCIFTINLGNYEGKQILLEENKYDTLYFTDSFEVIYDCVKKNILPFFVNTHNKEAKLLQRTIKTNPSEYLPYNYTRSVYVDGNFIIENFNELDLYIKQFEYDIICCEHKTRTNVKDEANEVIRLKLEKSANVKKLLNEFSKTNFKDNIGLTETGILIRNHKNIIEFNKEWCEKINICRRDQISFDFLLYKHNINYFRFSYKDKMSFIKIKNHINPKNRFIENPPS